MSTDPNHDPNPDLQSSPATDMSAYLGLFLDEGWEQLAILEADVLAIERGEATPDLLGALFRAAHTLKGSSRAMGFARVGNVTHELENILDDLRNGAIAATPEISDVLLEGVDALKSLMTVVSANGDDRDAEDFAPLVARMETARTGATGSAAPESGDFTESEETGIEEAWTLSETERMVIAEAQEDGQRALALRVALVPSCAMRTVRAFQVLAELAPLATVLRVDPSEDDLLAERFDGDLRLLVVSGADDDTIQRAVAAISEVATVAISDRTASSPSTPAAPAPSAAPGTMRTEAPSVPAASLTTAPAPNGTASNTSASNGSGTIRVGLDRLDALLNLVGELVIDRTQIARLASRLHADYGERDERLGELVEAVGRISRITSELQDEVMKTRTLPLDGVFARLPRMVRDVAAKTGKQIEFVVSGGETELDRSVLEMLGDPLIHILRNSVDHGVESPEERVAKGKPAAGTVALSARYEGSEIVIEISDDGRGIDPVTIRAAAVRKGIVGEAAAEAMGDREAIALILAPGFSTAATLSDISGRGVGMDIVKSNIDKIGGRLLIDSTVGQGSRFTLHLPLTLAILQALLVEVAGETCVLPLSSVVEIRSMTENGTSFGLATVLGQTVAVLRGDPIPVAGLWDVLCAEPRATELDRVTRHSHLVIVQHGERRIGLAVDSIAGEQEVVIKPIGALFGDLRGITGGSILGDGRVSLIVDIASAIEDVRAKATLAVISAPGEFVGA